jgi:hypothetical protein
MGVCFLAVKDPEGIKDETIGDAIKKSLAQGQAFYIAVVPELVRDYEFLFYSVDELSMALMLFEKTKAEV